MPGEEPLVPTTIDFAPLTLLPPSDRDNLPALTPSWNLTRAIHMLRLTIADASLRAREEARHHYHDTNEHWYVLGCARGYQKVAAVLRNWTHPEERNDVLAALEHQAWQAHAHAQRADTDNTVGFYDAYGWTLDWALTQVRELCSMYD